MEPPKTTMHAPMEHGLPRKYGMGLILRVHVLDTTCLGLAYFDTLGWLKFRGSIYIGKWSLGVVGMHNSSRHVLVCRVRLRRACLKT